VLYTYTVADSRDLDVTCNQVTEDLIASSLTLVMRQRRPLCVANVILYLFIYLSIFSLAPRYRSNGALSDDDICLSVCMSVCL